MSQELKLSFEYDSQENCYIAAIGQIYRVRAESDDLPDSPREWCNVATMVCHHRDYILGDEGGESDAIDAIRASRDYRDKWEESDSYEFTFKGETRDCFDFGNPSDVWQAIQLCSDIISQPLYLYDHSGISISTSSFSCPWDSGQVGFAFVTYAKIREEQSCKIVTAKGRNWAAQRIDSETRVYGQYLTGQVFGFIVQVATEWESESYCHATGEREAIASEWEDLDSCWGYYGNFDESGLASEALSAIVHDMRNRPQELQDKRESTLTDMQELIASRAQVTGQAREAIQGRIAALAADRRGANRQSRLIAGVV